MGLQQPAQPVEHPLLDDLERLAAGRAHVDRAQPRLQLARELLADLGEGHPVPGAELHLGEARLHLDTVAEGLGQDLRRLQGATHRRGDHGADPLGHRRQPVGDGPDLVPALVAEPGVGAGEAAGEALLDGVRRDAVPDQDHRRRLRRRTPTSPAPGSAWRPAPRRARLRSPRSATPLRWSPRCAARRAPRSPAGRRDRCAPAAPRCTSCRAGASRVASAASGIMLGVLDLPATRHLLDDELGVHPDLDPGVRRELRRQLEPGDQAGVLRDVVGRHSDRGAVLGDHLTGVGVLEHRAVRCRARVAPRAAVRLDQDPSSQA